MRCIVGVVMFVVLYFGVNFSVAEVASAMVRRDQPALSKQAADKYGEQVMERYHGLVGFVVLGFSAAAVTLPTVVLRWNERRSMSGMTMEDLYR